MYNLRNKWCVIWYFGAKKSTNDGEVSSEIWNFAMQKDQACWKKQNFAIFADALVHSFNSSVGRALDWRSEGHVFDSHLKQYFLLVSTKQERINLSYTYVSSSTICTHILLSFKSHHWPFPQPALLFDRSAHFKFINFIISCLFICVILYIVVPIYFAFQCLFIHCIMTNHLLILCIFPNVKSLLNFHLLQYKNTRVFL